MTFDLVLLVVHLALIAAVVRLYRSAPCWMQKCVVAGLGMAAFCICAGYLVGFLDGEEYSLTWLVSKEFISLGYKIEHIAVLIYVFRLAHQSSGEKWRTFLQHLPAFPRS